MGGQGQKDEPKGVKKKIDESKDEPQNAKGAKNSMDENALSNAIIGAAIEVHKQLGPGLLESAYEECLGFELNERHVCFERQKPIPVV